MESDPVKNDAVERAEQAPSPQAAASPGRPAVRNLILALALVCVSVAVAWSAFFSHQVSTDDAQVTAAPGG